MAHRIIVAQPIDRTVLTRLEALGQVYMNPGPEPLEPADLRRLCEGSQALMAFMTERVDEALLSAAPDLKIVAGAFKGFDNVDLDACARHQVAFTYVPDLLTKPTAELALGLMIALARNMRAGDAHIRSGDFHGWRPHLYGGSLDGATVGVLGAGKVGQALLLLLAGFDCTRICYDQAPLGPELLAELKADQVGLAELQARADFVVLGLPLTPQTTGLVDAAFIAGMRPGARLINPARGSVVVEAAVVGALASGHLAGYAADVFEMEDWARPDRPLSVHPDLLSAPNTFFTPHIGSAVVETRRAIEDAAAEEIIKALAE
ncbi:MAG: NAD(P)-dependent oxidoreductase [Pseudomonadota bacterium]